MNETETAKASSAFISEDSGALLEVRETESHAQNSGTFLPEHETEIDAGAFLQERENETAEQNSGAFLAEHGTETDAQDAGAFFPERENETDGQNSGAFLAEQETETETAAQDSGAFLQERGNETNVLDSDAFPQEREKETVASLSEREDVTRRHDNIVNARGLDVFFSEQEDMTEVVTLPGHHIPEDFHTLLPEPDAQAFCLIAQDPDAVVAECDVEGKAQDCADTDFVCEGVTSAEDSNSVVLQQVSVRKAQVSDASVADHDIETDAQERARNLDDLAAARAEVLSLQAALERTGLRLGQREQTLVELSQHMAEIERSLQTAEEARLDAENRAKQMGDFVDQADAKLSADGAKFVAMKKRLQQLEAVRDEALSNVETWKERAAAAERRSKQDARDTERELLQAQDTWREKIAAAERRTQEVKQDVEAQVEAAMVERDIAQGEVLRLVEELSGQKALQECAQKEVEAVVERSRAESAHLSERLRSSGETEFQLRREEFHVLHRPSSRLAVFWDPWLVLEGWTVWWCGVWCVALCCVVCCVLCCVVLCCVVLCCVVLCCVVFCGLCGMCGMCGVCGVCCVSRVGGGVFWVWCVVCWVLRVVCGVLCVVCGGLWCVRCLVVCGGVWCVVVCGVCGVWWYSCNSCLCVCWMERYPTRKWSYNLKPARLQGLGAEVTVRTIPCHMSGRSCISMLLTC